MREALKARQTNMDHVNATFREMEAEATRAQLPVAEHVQQKVETLNADWTKIQQMANHLQPASKQEEAIIEGMLVDDCINRTLSLLVCTTVLWHLFLVGC